MGLFRKKNPVPAPTPGATSAPASAGDPRLDRSRGLADILRYAEAERDAANASAAAEFGLGEILSWSMDLQAGTAGFVTPSGQWSGSVQVLGTLNAAASSWMWGWANPNISDELTTASFGVVQFGKENSVPALASMTLWADESEAGTLAALAFGYANSQFQFTTPTAPAVYLAVSEISPAGR